MAASQSMERKEEKGGRTMEKGGTGRVWSGMGWGLFLILVGVLIFSDNRGWLENGAGWLYLAIGLGVIFIIGFLVRFFGRGERWNAIGDLAAGVGLIYIGAVLLTGYGDWWPLVFVPFGLGYIIKSLMHNNRETVRG